MENHFYTKRSWVAQLDTDRYCVTDLPPPVEAIRYYLPLEILSSRHRTGRFHYFCYVYPRDQLLPVGYCAENCSGHSSKEQAREHYRQYLIDRFGRYDGRMSAPCACVLCGRMTTSFAKVEFHYEWDVIGLCRAHLNREGLADAFVLRDYHLLQVLQVGEQDIATMQECAAAISVVRPLVKVQTPGFPPPSV